MSKRTLLAAVTMGWMLGTAVVAQAQGPDSASLAQLRQSRFVRLETPSLGRIQGTVLQNSGSVVTLANGGQHVIPVESIRRAWVRGRHTKTGAIIGGILGAGGGLFLGLLADAFCEGDCSGSAVLPLTLLGTGAGAGTGAIIGSAFPRWKELH